MSINKLVSINNAIVDASDMLALDHDKFRPMFTSWATYAEKKIGGQGVLRKFAVIDICGCTALLPDDVSKVKGAILGAYDPNCGALFNMPLFANSFTARAAGSQFIVVDAGSVGDTPYCNIVPYEIQDNKMVFGYDVTQTQVTIY